MARPGDIKPTRSELLELKRKIKLTQSGYKILKMKRDGLILEFFKILEEAKDIAGELLKAYARRRGEDRRREGGRGRDRRSSRPPSPSRSPPEIELRQQERHGRRGPGDQRSSGTKPLVDARLRGHRHLVHIDEAAEAFENLVEQIIDSAEIETTMKRLLEEIEKTKRRVNALEFKVIPEQARPRLHQDAARGDGARELFRLKKIKARSQA